MSRHADEDYQHNLDALEEYAEEIVANAPPLTELMAAEVRAIFLATDWRPRPTVRRPRRSHVATAVVATVKAGGPRRRRG